LQVLLDAGDEVIIPVPFWVSYPEMVKLAQGRPIFIETVRKNNFKLTAAELKKAVNLKTKVLILNSPSNPTGVVYTKEELEALSNICINAKIYLISDEIYEKLIYDHQKHISIASFNKEIYNLTITVNGLSKSFSMTGWRIGYLGAPVEIAEAIERLQDHSTSNPTSISQKAGLAALEANNKWTEHMCQEFEKRRDYLISRLDKIKSLSYIKPGGAFYVFIDISQISSNSEGFASRLLQEENIALIPGKGFGKDNFIRVSFATSMEQIKKGMDRLEAFLAKING
jgi:aspartate aminotransferase